MKLGKITSNFTAEKANELNVSAGDTVILITALNSDWWIVNPFKFI
jgi:hypothetical protein